MIGRRQSSKRMSSQCVVHFEGLENRRLLAVDFSIATISDTQYAVENFPSNFTAQTQWIADHATDPAYNIAFMSHQGDMLRRGYSNFQAGNADTALKLLDGKVPYSASMGNHDYDNQFDDLNHHISSANFTSWFGNARYQAIPNSGFGGASLDQRNRYQIFSAGGRQFMLISLEWEAPDPAIAWAQSAINAHRDLPVIISTHAYLSGGARTTSTLDSIGNSGQAIFDKLVKLNPQIFMVLSGHTGSISNLVSTNNAGSNVYQICADFEGRPNGGDGWMQLISFDFTNGTISLNNLSPVTGGTETGAVFTGIDFAQRFNFGAVVANDDTQDVAPATPVTFDVRANDVDVNGLASSLVVTPGTLPAGVVQNADGTFTYQPDAGFAGNISFTYTASDGTTTSTPATVTLRVNTAPVGADDAAATPESKSVVVSPLANDGDADAGDAAALTPILATLPASGAVFVNSNQTFTYTPDPKFVGTDAFTYFLSDGKVTSGPYTVTVNVTAAAPVYDYPIAENTVAGTRSGSLAALQASDGVEESIAEVIRSSGLDVDQRWTFNVTGGTDVTFCVNARRSWGADEFHFQYSLNGSTWSDLTQLVTSSSKDVTRLRYEAGEPYQMWALPAATRGTVYIRATDTVGTSGDTVETLTVDEMFIRSGHDATAPTAPTNLQATSTQSTSIALAWTASTDNVGVAAYDVYRVDPLGDVIVATSATNSVTVNNLSPQTTYSFYVVARDAAGNASGESNTVTATTTAAPVAPSNLTASKKNRQVQLNWRDNSSNETGFHIWSSRDGVNWTLLTTVGANTTKFLTSSLARGTWYFRVTSYIDTLDSTPSNVVSVNV